MKTLFLLRHAKSSRDDVSLPDFDRPLNPRGMKDAPCMGALLRERDLVPDHVITSPALRARQTAEAAMAAAGYSGAIMHEQALYAADRDAYLAAACAIPDTVSRALIVGHNPDIEDFIEWLTGHLQEMPTAAFAWLELPIDAWRDLRSRTATLKTLWKPKELG